ncbi:unnamed protein product [Bursaphelenchus xylophilus]|nr:unnamed protein product [Bursaphelenchus xylophilus]CAG9111640.1 unnamed protein product [Bursaphelenchus xylophilus]
MEQDSGKTPVQDIRLESDEVMDDIVDSVDAFVADSAKDSPNKRAALANMDNNSNLEPSFGDVADTKSLDASMEPESLARQLELKGLVIKSPMSERMRPGAPVEIATPAKKRKLAEPTQKSTVPKYTSKQESIEMWLQSVRNAADSSDSSNSVNIFPKMQLSDSNPSNGSNTPNPTSPCNPETGTSAKAANTSSSTMKAASSTTSTPRGQSVIQLNVPYLERRVTELEQDCACLRKEKDSLIRENLEHKLKRGEYKIKMREMLIDKARKERAEARLQTQKNMLRLGSFYLARNGEKFEDKWKSGTAFEENLKKMVDLGEERDLVNSQLEQLKKRKAVRRTRKSVDPAADQNDENFARPDDPSDAIAQELYEQEEIVRIRRDAVKKEEADLILEREMLERERNLHIREYKRIQYEDQSNYKNYMCFSEKYLLLTLLGKGGFSEVWQAYDLDDNRYVAVKIHQVCKEWKEEKKANYVKHAMREKNIHISLHHPRIVQLFDVFHIDNHTFCTVLEYCGGNDLDVYLKQNKQIPEKEARCIIMQVVSALRYLASHDPPIIHYDLKPANILLEDGTASGAVKITDFGLSKMVDSSDDGDSIELTSQGAGTYWYLPPETFQRFGHTAPRISNKVDVWSVGIIFFQCLYGQRPFGHDQSQQQLLNERVILNARDVRFPPSPKISAGAQEFIRSCLRYEKDLRPDVRMIANHSYLKPRPPPSRAVS